MMNPDIDKPQPERAQTDESLRTERQSVDHAIVERRTDLEESADDLVARAREQADVVLDAAREKADHKMDVTEPGPPVRKAVARARAREDEVLQDERAAADETLRRERDEEARTLAALLPLEREKTDRYLLTERARADVALANRDDFLGMVSHDLRNLLSGVAMNATMIAEKASDSDEGRRTVAGMKRMHGYVARMNRLIGDLVDVVSIDAGKLALRRESSDAAALLTEAVDAFGLSASSKGISLACSRVDAELRISFDRERMLQVLANLVTNALKFTDRGGRVVLSGERVGNELHLSVRDSGAGIPPHMLEAVFERFWQVGKNDQRGLGLGLYIAKCIVDAHGGRIWAESALGVGSTFHITLPATAPSPS